MRVRFDLSKNEMYETYSTVEYDRLPIDSILYRKCLNKITHRQWRDIIQSLNIYKTTEMIVHNNSIHNIRLHDNECNEMK